MRGLWAQHSPAAVTPPTAVDPPLVTSFPSAGPCRVLCVETGAESRRTLLTALERHACATGGFDALVTNRRTPRGPGVALVRRLRKCGFRCGIVVAAESLTPFDRAAYRALAVAALWPRPIALRATDPAPADRRSLSSASGASRSPFSSQPTL